MNLVKFFAAFGLMIASAFGDPVVTTDPLAQLRGVYDFEGVKKIYKLSADINNDGVKEVFLTPIEPDEQNSDVGWYVYIGKAGGRYLLAGEAVGSKVDHRALPTFSRNHYWVGYIPEISKYGLLTLKSGRGGHALCQLHAIVIEGDAWKDIPIGSPVRAEENFDRLARRFPKPLSPVVKSVAP